MPETTEQPIAPAVNPRYAGLRPFNSQTASQAARRKHELDKLRAEEAKRMPVAMPANDKQDYRLELLSEQIALTRASLLKSNLEPKDRAQLIRGLCGLLDQQRIARGEPLPGSRRPKPEREPRTSPTVLEPQIPQEPQSLGQDTPTN
jgi:hypothetical protein